METAPLFKCKPMTSTISALLLFLVLVILFTLAALLSQPEVAHLELNLRFNPSKSTATNHLISMNRTPGLYSSPPRQIEHSFWSRLSGAPRIINSSSYDDSCRHFLGCPNADYFKSQKTVQRPFNILDGRRSSSTEGEQAAGINSCPFYFRYIYEDLAPWSSRTGSSSMDAKTRASHLLHGMISKEMLEYGARSRLASFRVIIKDGRLYVDAYRSCFQTRALFTIWGLLQLLDFYPGLVHYVDMLFACGDTPMVPKTDLDDDNLRKPPIFSYCSSGNHLDIPFPDWSFWGWPEIDLGSWDTELSGILKAQDATMWDQRGATAFWKGNTRTGGLLRQHLTLCNAPPYNAQIIHQDWHKAAQDHYKNSRLAEQCKNRYKVYVEGWGWSASLKYILGCDSVVLLVDPLFHDFFSRGLVPLVHFWPIRRDDHLCDSIKFGVEWGNSHPVEARKLGQGGRQFISKEVSMKHVYDYMLHAINEYAKILNFEPTPTRDMVLMCSKSFLCQAPEKERLLYYNSRVRMPSSTPPCAMENRNQN